MTRVANVADAAARKVFSHWTATVKSSDGYAYTSPAGHFRSNAFGLHDMHGNVQEWCADSYDADYYAKSPKEDPQGPKEGTERVLRGGAWPSSAKACRSAARNHLPPAEKTYTCGFRVVLDAK